MKIPLKAGWGIAGLLFGQESRMRRGLRLESVSGSWHCRSSSLPSGLIRLRQTTYALTVIQHSIRVSNDADDLGKTKTPATLVAGGAQYEQRTKEQFEVAGRRA